MSVSSQSQSLPINASRSIISQTLKNFSLQHFPDQKIKTSWILMNVHHEHSNTAFIFSRKSKQPDSVHTKLSPIYTNNNVKPTFNPIWTFFLNQINTNRSKSDKHQSRRFEPKSTATTHSPFRTHTKAADQTPFNRIEQEGKRQNKNGTIIHSIRIENSKR